MEVKLAEFYPSERLACREQFGLLLNDLGLTGAAVEIGTHIGNFAISLLSVWRGRCLHVVDPWETYADYLSELDLATHEPLEPKQQVFRERTAPFAHRICIHHGHSPAALAWFLDESLDFGYIDGNHKKPYVAADLAALWPKIRPGGIMAGHDFESSGPWANDTRAAVQEFFGAQGLFGYWVPGDAHSWYVYKGHKPESCHMRPGSSA